MPVQIGGPRDHSFESPLQLLSDCHRRIEHFLNVLFRVASQAGDSLSSEESKALATALRYFREAAPRHTEDEEKSLFPRLKGLQSSALEESLAQLDLLEADHVMADRLHAAVERTGQEWLASGSLPTIERERFQTRISALRDLYKSHIELEDTVIFPLASRLLDANAQLLIGKEMATRRRG